MTADTDRELLEAAARAAGMVVLPHDRPWRDEDKGWFYNEHGAGGMHSNERPAHWNALTSDADALRLAVKLRLMVHISGVLVDGVHVQSEHGVAKELYGTDPYAATRRAIVRAAAEVGRA